MLRQPKSPTIPEKIGATSLDCLPSPVSSFRPAGLRTLPTTALRREEVSLSLNLRVTPVYTKVYTHTLGNDVIHTITHTEIYARFNGYVNESV